MGREREKRWKRGEGVGWGGERERERANTEVLEERVNQKGGKHHAKCFCEVKAKEETLNTRHSDSEGFPVAQR